MTDKLNVEETVPTLPQTENTSPDLSEVIGELKQLQHLKNLNHLEQLLALDELTKLEQLKELKNLSDLEKLDNLTELAKLTKLEKLNQLEDLTQLEKLSSLDQLQKLESLSGLDKLSELSKLAELEKLSELSLLKKLNVLDDLPNNEKIIEFKNFLNENIEELNNSKVISKLEHLQQLEKLDRPLKHLLIHNIVTGALDFTKIAVICIGIFVFLSYSKENALTSNFIHKLQMDSFYQSSVILTALEKSMTDPDFSTYKESYIASVNNSLKDLYNPEFTETLYSKFHKLQNMTQLEGSVKQKDIKDVIKKIHDTEEFNLKMYFSELSDILLEESIKRPEIQVLYRQITLNIHGGSHAQALPYLKKLKQMSGDKVFIQASNTLILDYLIHKKKITDQKSFLSFFSGIR